MSLIPIRSRTTDVMPELAPAAEPLLSPLALGAFVVSVAGAGALANCAALAALLKRPKNGIFSIIIQLAVTDLLLGTVVAPEIWTWNARTWCFRSSGCIAHQGLNVFASTASLYLVAAMALHTLATINLEEKAIQRRIKRTDQDEIEEIKSSRHSLVANSDSSTPPRTMNVDYRLADTIVPVTLPTVFVWILSASLSVPEFTLATIVNIGNGTTICTLDSNHRHNMHSMLAFFILFVPLLIMSTASALLVVKLKSKILNRIDNCESIAALKLSLWLILVYGILCAPRSVFSAYGAYSESSENDIVVELFHQDNRIQVISLVLSCAYLTATLVRPLLYIIMMPQLRKLFLFRSKDIVDNV